jgi:cytochrome P450
MKKGSDIMETTRPEIARPYEEIPFVEFPDDYNEHLAPLLAEAYAQHGPIFRGNYFGQEIVFLAGPEANRFVLVNNRQKFSHHIGWSQIFDITSTFGHGLLTMDGDEHAQQRRVMNPAFTVNYMAHYLPLMNQIIRTHTERWREVGEIDLPLEMRKITFDVAAQALTGLQPGEEVDRFREIFVGLLIGPQITETNEEEYQAFVTPLQEELRTLLLPKIEERRQHPIDDVFGRLVQALDANGLMSEEQLIAHINILLVAGHETSTSLASWLLYLLHQHPDYTQRILDEQEAVLGQKADPDLDDIKAMKVLDNALSEAERLYPPVANGPRGVIEEFTFHDYQVPAGTRVFYSILTSHLIPEIFKNPWDFDPDRFAPPREEHKKVPYSLVGFGGGPRICIGINFAQVEIKALVSYVLRNFTLKLTPGQDIQQFYDVTGHPTHGIRMQVQQK